MSTILTALQSAKKSMPDASLEAEILLSHVLEKNRAYLYAHPEMELNEAQMNRYLDLIKHRMQGIPIAYLLSHREFWTLSLKVTPDTLIPRHETERLVELVLEYVPNIPHITLLDLGTGSGAIALAIAKERPHWNIDA